eukprot:scaffold129384_cov30-Tisochrysis_lutea.AAC.5
MHRNSSAAERRGGSSSPARRVVLPLLLVASALVIDSLGSTNNAKGSMDVESQNYYYCSEMCMPCRRQNPLPAEGLWAGGRVGMKGDVIQEGEGALRVIFLATKAQLLYRLMYGDKL